MNILLIYRNVFMTCFFNKKNLFFLFIFYGVIFLGFNHFCGIYDQVFITDTNIDGKPIESLNGAIEAMENKTFQYKINESTHQTLTEKDKSDLLDVAKLFSTFRFYQLFAFTSFLLLILCAKPFLKLQPEINAKSYKQLFYKLPEKTAEHFYNFFESQSKIGIYQLPILPIIFLVTHSIKIITPLIKKSFFYLKSIYDKSNNVASLENTKQNLLDYAKAQKHFKKLNNNYTNKVKNKPNIL